MPDDDVWMNLIIPAVFEQKWNRIPSLAWHTPNLEKFIWDYFEKSNEWKQFIIKHFLKNYYYCTRCDVNQILMQLIIYFFFVIK